MVRKQPMRLSTSLCNLNRCLYSILLRMFCCYFVFASSQDSRHWRSQISFTLGSNRAKVWDAEIPSKAVDMFFRCWISQQYDTNARNHFHIFHDLSSPLNPFPKRLSKGLNKNRATSCNAIIRSSRVVVVHVSRTKSERGINGETVNPYTEIL